LQQATKLQAACAKKEEFATYPVLMVAMEDSGVSSSLQSISVKISSHQSRLRGSAFGGGYSFPGRKYR